MTSIFISYARADLAHAQVVKAALAARGYEGVFLDVDPSDGIEAGARWEEALYRNLKICRALIALVSPRSEASRWCFAEIALAKSLRKEILPLKIEGDRIPTILSELNAIEIGALETMFVALERAGLDPRDSFGWDPKRSPYPGFEFFDREDAGVYFGRGPEVGEAIEMLKRLRAPSSKKLAVIVGASGTGKSSLMRAGVLPRLAKDPARWHVLAPFRPGAKPLLEAERSLGGLSPNQVVAAQPPDRTVIWPIDQLEEVFAHASADDAREFFALLAQASALGGRSLIVLATLRSDALVDLQRQRALELELMNLGPMPRDRLPQIIEGPASRAAVSFETGLVQRIADDAGSGDALPLLAFTLREIYERRRGEQITTVSYDALGGIGGVIADVTRALPIDGSLRAAFLMLASINDEGRFVRRTAAWTDLPASARPLIEKLIDRRLLSSRGDPRMIEVVHESLFSAWPSLHAWLTNHRDLLAWKRRVDVTDPLRGPQLAQALTFREREPESFTVGEHSFIEASSRAARRRLRLVAALAACSLTIFATLSVVTWFQRAEALRAARVAEAGRLALESEGSGPESALATAVAAIRATTNAGDPPTDQAMHSLERAVDATGGIGFIGHDGEIIAVATSGNLQWIASSGGGLVRASLLSDDRILAKWKFRSNANKLAINDHAIVFASSETLSIADLATGEERRLFSSAETTFVSDTIAAVATADGQVLAWSSRTSSPLLDSTHPNVRILRASKDGHWLIATGDDTSIWDLSNGSRQRLSQIAHTEPTGNALVSADARWIVTANFNEGRTRSSSRITFWRLDKPLRATKTVTIDAAYGDQATPELTLNGSCLAVRNLFDAHIYSLEGETVEKIKGFTAISSREIGPSPITVVATDETCKNVLIGEATSSPRLYRGPMEEQLEFSFILADARFSPGSTWLVTQESSSQELVVYLSGAPKLPLPLRGHDAFISQFAFTFEGNGLISGDRAGHLHYWALDEEERRQFPDYQSLDTLGRSRTDHELIDLARQISGRDDL